MVKGLTMFFFHILFAMTLIFCKTVNAQTAESPKCKEDCVALAEKNKTQLEACLANAKNIKDPFVSVKTKQNCRKRYVLPLCDKMEPCKGGKQNAYQNDAPAYEMGPVEFVRGEKSFAPKQKVSLRCLVKTLRREKGNAWFSQDIVIQDTHGNIVYQDNQSLERGGEMVSSYEFKTEFSIPENFEPGIYSLKFRIREKFSRWEGEKEIQLKITKK